MAGVWFQYLMVVFLVSVAAQGDSGTQQMQLSRLITRHQSRHTDNSISTRKRLNLVDHRRKLNNLDRKIYHETRNEPPLLKRAEAVRVVHGAREDPRLYYQSDQYFHKALSKNDLEGRRRMTSLFPNLEPQLARIRLKTDLQNLDKTRDHNRASNLIFEDELCIKCPSDRTLVLRPGETQVTLRAPRLETCTGGRPPRGVNYHQLRGPRPGSRLLEGVYEIEGSLVFRKQFLQRCRRIVVRVERRRRCSLPPGLRAACVGPHCNITCSDAKSGTGRTLVCGDDQRWSGDLPVCAGTHIGATRCPTPLPPAHGRISCDISTEGVGGSDGMERGYMVEGSRCRVQCAAGWRKTPRADAVCHHGRWTAPLTCRHLLTPSVYNNFINKSP